MKRYPPVSQEYLQHLAQNYPAFFLHSAVVSYYRPPEGYLRTRHEAVPCNGSHQELYASTAAAHVIRPCYGGNERVKMLNAVRNQAKQLRSQTLPLIKHLLRQPHILSKLWQGV